MSVEVVLSCKRFFKLCRRVVLVKRFGMLLSRLRVFSKIRQWFVRSGVEVCDESIWVSVGMRLSGGGESK